MKLQHSLKSRIERARQLHKDGYNCSQCVIMVFDDIHNAENELISKLSSGFGGGVGGQRQVCGTISGMTMVLGLLNYNSPKDKISLYSYVQEYSNVFKQANGSIVCGELLKPSRKPCMALIEDAITIIDNKLRIND